MSIRILVADGDTVPRRLLTLILARQRVMGQAGRIGA